MYLKIMAYQIVVSQIDLTKNEDAEKNNSQDLSSEELGKILDEVFEKNGLLSKESGQMCFDAIDKEIGTVLFEFLEKNVELRERENYILRLINGIIDVHGSLDVSEIFKALKKLEIDLSYDEVKKFIISKVPDTLVDNSNTIVIHERDFDDYFNGIFVKNTIKDIHPLETYLNSNFRI